MGLGRFTSRARRSLGPLSSGSKGHDTHNAPPFPNWNFMFLQLGKILYFKPRVWKVERTGKLMRTSNALEGEACLVTKRVGSAHFLVCLRHMMF